MKIDNEKTDIVNILRKSALDNKITCAGAFDICNKNTVFPDIAGLTMNQYKLKITHCQLGLFGYQEGKKIPECEIVSEKLEGRISEYIENGKLPCAAAWNIASEMNIKKPEVASACEKLGIKINKCQLGAF